MDGLCGLWALGSPLPPTSGGAWSSLKHLSAAQLSGGVDFRHNPMPRSRLTPMEMPFGWGGCFQTTYGIFLSPGHGDS